MSRNKLSTAEKKLKGTFRKDRASEQDKNEQIIATTNFVEGTQLEVPAELTDDFVKSYYKFHTQQLIKLHILSPADIQELNQLYITLQQLRKIQKEINETSINDLDKYERLTKLSIKLGNRFSDLAKKYYISPVARTRLQLDNELLKTKQIENSSVIGKLISEKTS